MATDEDGWRKQSFRKCIIAKIDEAVQLAGLSATKNSIDIENHVFQKSKTKDDYLGFVAKQILHIRELNSKNATGGSAPGTAGSGNQRKPHPTGALQTVACQGTGNNQMMNMNGPGSNPKRIILQPANTAKNCEDGWRKKSFRKCIIAKIDEAVQLAGLSTTKDSIEIENYVFQKSKTKDEYLGFIARKILYLRELNSKKATGGSVPGTAGSGNQRKPHPIGALQTVACQGTGNNQMMNMNGPGCNPPIIISQPTNSAKNQLNMVISHCQMRYHGIQHQNQAT